MNAYSIPGLQVPTVHDVVSRHFDVSAELSRNHKTRRREAVELRQFVMYIMITYHHWSESKSGGQYGKDHATAHHAKISVQNLLKTDKIFARKANNAIAELKTLKLI